MKTRINTSVRRSMFACAAASLFSFYASSSDASDTLPVPLAEFAPVNQPGLLAATGCSDAVNIGWRTAIEMIAFVPGVGEFGKLAAGVNRLMLFQRCSNGAQAADMLEELMQEMERLVDRKIDERFKEDLVNLYTDLFSQYKAVQPLLEPAAAGELSRESLLNVINQVQNLASDASSLESKTLAVDWPGMAATSLIGGLKNTLNSILAHLFEVAGPELNPVAEAFNYVMLPLEREDSIEAFLTKEKQFLSLYRNISLEFRSNRKHVFLPLGGATRFTIDVKVTDSNGKTVYERDWSCRAHNSARYACKNKWESRKKQFLREALEARETERKQLVGSLDDRYFDYRNALQLEDGHVFSLTNKAIGDARVCLDVPVESDSHPLSINNCSIQQEHLQQRVIEAQDIASATDLWRFHGSDGMIIHENSGLCLTTDGEQTITMQACDYENAQTRAHQSWAINPLGFIVDIESGRCLNIDPLSGASSMQVNLAECEYNRTFSAPRDGEEATHQIWEMTYVTCDDDNLCGVTREYSAELGAVRKVLQADQAQLGESGTQLESDLQGFTDTGYLTLNEAGASASWNDGVFRAGSYRLSLRHQADAITEQALVISADAEPIATLTIPATGGDWEEIGVDIELPANVGRLSIEAAGYSAVFIDRVSLVPVL